MTRDLDDDAIAQLVRDTASGWVMPPVRLDAPAWRERILSPRDRRVAAGVIEAAGPGRGMHIRAASDGSA